MGKRIDFANLAEVGVNSLGAGQSIPSIDVHGTRAANTCRRKEGNTY